MERAAAARGTGETLGDNLASLHTAFGSNEEASLMSFERLNIIPQNPSELPDITQTT